MKKYFIRLTALLLIMIGAAVLMNMWAEKLTAKRLGERNIVTQRITHDIEQQLHSETSENIAYNVFYSDRQNWEQLYGSVHCPDEIHIILFDENTDMKRIGGNNTIVCGIYDDNGIAGVVEYHFNDTVYQSIIRLMNICLICCGAVILLYGLWIGLRLILPFDKLSKYPERLSKGSFTFTEQSTGKLNGTRSPYFGKFVWGMNMLSDRLENDRQTISRLSSEREKFVTALVHGIKTPAANIKLLAEAISMGLYDPNGEVNENDAMLAGKIEKNVDEIEELVKKVLTTDAAVIYDFDPDAEAFYRHILADRIREEYADRLKIGRVPFDVISEGDPLIKSDIDGVCRILRQLMDNALKYGDGTGITLTMEKRDEGHFISLANKGTPLPDNELPFVWGSFWRGSNSEGIKGSGVGLYESRYIARKLGGDLFMRTDVNTTEVTLFLPL